MFVDVLFASYAHLGAFIINGNYFMSQKGTGANGTTEINYYDDYNNFNPYLKMDARTGEIWARKGTIGGFVIGEKTLGTNYSSGTTGGTYIRKDGYMRIYNVDNYTGLSVIGGFELLGQGIYAVIDNIAGTMYQRAQTFNINTDANPNNNVNIGGVNTQSVNINASATNFGSSTPVNIGNALAVTGLASFTGSVYTSSFTLPGTTSKPPKVGTICFGKGI